MENSFGDGKPRNWKLEVIRKFRHQDKLLFKTFGIKWYYQYISYCIFEYF